MQGSRVIPQKSGLFQDLLKPWCRTKPGQVGPEVTLATTKGSTKSGAAFLCPPQALGLRVRKTREGVNTSKVTNSRTKERNCRLPIYKPHLSRVPSPGTWKWYLAQLAFLGISTPGRADPHRFETCCLPRMA